MTSWWHLVLTSGVLLALTILGVCYRLVSVQELMATCISWASSHFLGLVLMTK